MSRIFISYRREDAAPHAGRLHDRLSGRFGADNVFRDIDDIRPGQDFTRVLEETLGGSDALVVVIGRKWLSPRLFSPEDFVHKEIVTALNHSIPVFPALVDGASMPGVLDLPEALRPLARRQALELTDSRYYEDTGRLIAALEERPFFRNRKAVLRMVLAAASLCIASLGAWMYQTAQTAKSAPAPSGETRRLRSGGAAVTRDQLNAAVTRFNFYARGVNEAGGVNGSLERQVIEGAVVIVDRIHRLMWQQGGSRKAVDNAGAAGVASAANSSRLAGFEDWRLPTAEEALSLMTPKQQDNYYLSPLFDRTGAPFTWTSDRHPEGKGWVVYYRDGYASTEPMSFHSPVRLVRTIP